MYKQTGEISASLISKLKSMAEQVRWEHHVSDITDHYAADCTELVKSMKALKIVEPYRAATLMRLAPGGKLYRHADTGFGLTIPIETNDDVVNYSYHPVPGNMPELTGPTTALGQVDKKEHRLKVGKIYHTDRSVEHEAFNNGETDRVFLIALLK